MKLNHNQKETAIEAIRFGSTLKAGASAAGISIDSLKTEMRRSGIFKKRIQEALEEGKLSAGDDSIQFLIDTRDGKFEKTDRNRVTAAIALANWGKPGFRGATTVQGRIDHDVRVITAVPRPQYNILEPVKVISKIEKTKTIKTEIRDDNGNLLAIKRDTVEDAIEGEIIKQENKNE